MQGFASKFTLFFLESKIEKNFDNKAVVTYSPLPFQWQLFFLDLTLTLTLLISLRRRPFPKLGLIARESEPSDERRRERWPGAGQKK